LIVGTSGTRIASETQLAVVSVPSDAALNRKPLVGAASPGMSATPAAIVAEPLRRNVPVASSSPGPSV
jgi:hypothetical protein